jgi:hypothetical protein
MLGAPNSAAASPLSVGHFKINRELHARALPAPAFHLEKHHHLQGLFTKAIALWGFADEFAVAKSPIRLNETVDNSLAG